MKKLITIGAMLIASLAQAQPSADVEAAQQLVNRHFEIWNDSNAAQWAAKMPQVYTKDVVMADYGGVATGYAEITHLIQRVQGDHPGFSFKPGPVALNHGIGRVTWSFGPKDNPEQIHGEDIFTIKNGRLASLNVFLDKVGGPLRPAGVSTPGIDHVGINVPDLKQAEAFLVSIFGCEPVTQIGPFNMAPRADSVTLAMVRCGNGANIELFEYKNSSGSSVMPKSEDFGASHIAFYTDDVQAGVAYLKSQGITVLGEPMTMTSGDTEGETWVHFLSPWGSEMELVGYPNGKGYEKNSKARLWNAKRPVQ